MNKAGYQQKILEEQRKMKIICPYCKHRVHFYAFENQDKRLCKYCGNYVFKNEKEKFMYRLKENMLREKSI